MSEWLSYRLSDFLLFSEKTYFRLFELHNNALWPLPWITAALGLLMIAQVYSGKRYRHLMISALLFVVWMWVGWAFHLQRYATINWAAPAFAILFFIEAALIAWFGLLRTRLQFPAPRNAVDGMGLGLAGYALVVHPLLGPLLHGQWARSEVFGLAPDPTAIATLGLLLLSRGPHRWLLLIAPGLWALTSAATLFAMGHSQFWIPLLAIGVAVIVVARQTLGRTPQSR